MRRLRKILLAAAVGAVLVWIALSEPESKSSKPNNGGASAAAPTGSSALPARVAFRNADGDPFAPRAWGAAPTRFARAAPAPSAPPLPFRFVGRVYQEGGTRVYLARGAKVLAVAEGDLLDGEYRVDSVSGSAVTFVYLPTGQRQMMALSTPIEETSRASQPAQLNRNESLTLGRTSRAGNERLE